MGSCATKPRDLKAQQEGLASQPTDEHAPATVPDTKPDRSVDADAAAASAKEKGKVVVLVEEGNDDKEEEAEDNKKVATRKPLGELLKEQNDDPNGTTEANNSDQSEAVVAAPVQARELEEQEHRPVDETACVGKEATQHGREPTKTEDSVDESKAEPEATGNGVDKEKEAGDVKVDNDKTNKVEETNGTPVVVEAAK